MKPYLIQEEYQRNYKHERYENYSPMYISCNDKEDSEWKIL